MEFKFINSEAPAYFDEGPPIRDRVGDLTNFINTSSIDISAGDAYMQGVELTTQRRYDAGIVKIWSGESGHVFSKTWYGMDANVPLVQPHSDIDKFDPVDYIEAQVILEGSTPLYTFPIIMGDNDQRVDAPLNGIIEPLTIRNIVAFSGIDVPDDAHTIKGTPQTGNEDQAAASDAIVNVFPFDARSLVVPYLDSSDMMGTIQLPGFFIGDKSELGSYVERDAVPQPADIVSLMRPANDSYVPSNHVAATAGFVFAPTSGVATDSIAFGDMAH